MDFVHLHLHTEYSLLDGCCRISRLFDAVKAKGQTAVAITDHGVMYGAVDFYKAAVSAGIKPIIGCEVYVAEKSRHDKQKAVDNFYSHLILLCKNAEGYGNLIKLVSLGFTEGFYSKPRVDKELLERYSSGLICLSACLAGEIPRKILAGDVKAAEESALWYERTFGKGNYYLELQNHGIPEQSKVNAGLSAIHKNTGIPLVATNDVHYIDKKDADTHKVLLAIQTGKKLSEEGGLEFPTDEFYLKSGDEMASLFADYPDAVRNTVKIADECNFDFEFGNIKIPRIDIGRDDHFSFLKEKCYEGLYRIYGQNPDTEIIKRLDYELSVIDKMGYTDYFLIVRDFVLYAKNKGIPVGPGRGSGAGSLAAYCLSITGIDPIKYDLIFERFLNPERVSMPDFDIDFCYVRRSEVIDYVINKYGKDRVAQIVTFGTMAAKNSVRDVGRVMDIPYATCDRVAKLIPFSHNSTLSLALKTAPELKELYDNDITVKKLIDMAMEVEGMPRHASTHAAGVVISDRPVSEYVPLSLNDDSVVTQYTMTALDELGLLKMDFLGLRNLTVIDDTVKSVKRTNPDFDIEKIPLDDKEVLRMLGEGNSDGVFQFESAGMKNVLRSFKPESIEDLIAILSLYRPGPMDAIPKYIHNRFHPEDVKYPTELLRPILSVTYGCIVYQEQVMQIFRSLAGYSFGRADIVRRAMAKKKHAVMEKERNSFVYGEKDENGNTVCTGCVNNGIDEKTALALFDEMAAFSSYAFNKSHAAAYGYLAYQTAYLKKHYSAEYMAALLTSVLEDASKVNEYTAECSRMGIKVLPPDVNESEENFTATKDGIRFGLLAVKNLGRGVIRELITLREAGGEYTSLYDFCLRNRSREFNRRAVEGLIKSGAFDSFGETRKTMLYSLDTVLSAADSVGRFTGGGQMDMFSDEEPGDIGITTDGSEFPLSVKLSMEKEVTGLYLSGHPMEEFREYAEFIRADKVKDIVSGVYPDRRRVSFVGLISGIKVRTLKNGNLLCSFTAEDISAAVDVTVFSKVYNEIRTLLTENAVLKINGSVSEREDRPVEILLDSVEALPKFASYFKNPQKKVPDGLYIRVRSIKGEETEKIIKILSGSPGKVPVYFYAVDENKKYPYKKGVSGEDIFDVSGKISEIIGKENVKSVENR